ncbi:ABC transporter substrate-binding protein [uncultured Cohaesibacter sp.]|uniref:ABC transporter substrate-binding protein n=1 Tax=uncultured Cohaesibacter sp. TaxID=1002546 RepID=UPI002AA8B3DF|nr:ABC transporter substrate-binding protein [uncultured Cohaesibacter sp.]
MLRKFWLAALMAGAAFPALANDGVLDVVAPFEIVSADPVRSGNIFQKMDVIETLVDSDDKGRLLPGLATEWVASEDGLVWTFTLRSDVTFHDGSKMDGASVATSLEHSRAKGGLLAKAPIDRIEADGNSVRFILSSPFAMLPAMLAEYRSGIIAPSAIDANGTVTALVGTGAYRATSLMPPNKLEAERFEDYWGKLAAIPLATYSAVSRSETRALMAEGGDADVTINLDPASVKRLAQLDSLEVVSVSIPRILMLKVNAEVFDLETRKALSLAIDRDGIAKAVLRYPAGATQMFPPKMAQWHDDSLPPLEYDPQKARDILAKLGWTAQADGVLQKDGKPLEIELLTYPDRPELPLAAAVLQQQFAAIGAKAEINATNFSEIPAKHKSGTLSTALFARNFALVPDPVGTLLEDYAPTGDWGAMGWNNEAFTNTVNMLAAGAVDEDARAEARKQIVQTLQSELPVLPIAWYQQTMAVSNEVTGLVVDPFERTLGLKSMEWAQ